MNLEKMDRLIDAWRDEIFERLKGWIAIPSVNAPRSAENAPFGEQVRRMLDLFLSDARALGFEAEEFDGYCAHAVLHRGERNMGILAHLDVVPAGDGWTTPPFEGVLKDGRFYGRGAMDDKGPAMAALYAMRAVREAGIALRDGVRLIVGCDEETGMTDMRHYAQVASLPDYGFSPDAEYPLINIEKGGLNLELSAAAPCDEKSALPVFEMWAGERVNVVPGVASALVGTDDVPALNARLEQIARAHENFSLCAKEEGCGRARITATGVGAHASMPHLGVNAAGMLLIALSELGAGGESFRGAAGALARKLGMEHDGTRLGIRISDSLSGALTCNLGILRYDGLTLRARLDIRYPISADEQTMCGQAAMALRDTPISIRHAGGHTPLHVPAESDVVRKLLAVYHEQTGLEPKALAIGGGTYSRMMPNTVGFGINFPGDTDTCHMPDEYVIVEKFMTSVHIMAHSIVRLAGEE